MGARIKRSAKEGANAQGITLVPVLPTSECHFAGYLAPFAGFFQILTN